MELLVAAYIGALALYPLAHLLAWAVAILKGEAK